MHVEISKIDVDTEGLDYEVYSLDPSNEKFLNFLKESLCDCFGFNSVTFENDKDISDFSESDWYLVQDEHGESVGILNYHNNVLKISVM